MPALKDHIDGVLVESLAAELAAVWDGFPVASFVSEANDGLGGLELKDRLRHVADALAHALPDDVVQVVEVLDGALASSSFAGWMVWPVTELIGRFGPAHPEVIVPFLARLTPRSTCEFAIRPCIDRHPDLTFSHLEAWVDHPDEHVRRLVSEGTRPRLPWGARLRFLQADPSPALALLDRLRDDPSEYVRRSVANHLGDVVKDHPELAIATAERWKAEGGDHVDSVIRHALRTLIKAGDPDALRLTGYDVDAVVRLVELTIEPSVLPIGEQATISVQLATDGDGPVPVVAEYVVHYLGARAPRKPKAYRLGERILQVGAVTQLRRRHTFKHASIRTLYPGEHLVELQVNGRVLGSGRIEFTG